MSKSSNFLCSKILIIFVIPIVIAVLTFYYYNSNIQGDGNNNTTRIPFFQPPPPADYGNGMMFNKIASRYDIINRILALGMDISWRQRMVQIIVDRVLLLQHVPENNNNHSDDDDSTTTTTDQSNIRYIVDFATGTADVAILLGKEIQKRTLTSSSTSTTTPKVQIMGVDPSEQMIAIGRQKIQDKTSFSTSTTNNPKISTITTTTIQPIISIDLLISDTQNLTYFKNLYPNRYYDGATMAFGIRNVPNRERALCEIYTTLHVNATFCILEFSEPSNTTTNILSILVRYFIRYIIPIIGGILSGYPKEYIHLQNSIQQFPSPTEFIHMMEQLHCTSTTTVDHHHHDDNNNDINTMNTNHNNHKHRAYHFDDLIQMNFGSVQLYVFRTLPPSL